jgi:hypothetical protein
LRDALTRYERVLGYPPPEEIGGSSDGWELVAWLEHAVAVAHVPKALSTYTPPAPYRVFRLATLQDSTALLIRHELFMKLHI